MKTGRTPPHYPDFMSERPSTMKGAVLPGHSTVEFSELAHMAELAERLSAWNLHPERTVTHRFPLDRAAAAYRVADEGQSGKVVITFDEA
jgi:threonine dehydrogenase-like Zn-dependent dehydrogenase